MKRFRFVIMCIFAVSHVCAQNLSDALFVYRNDDAVNIFFRSQVDSIVFSGVGGKETAKQGETMQETHVGDKVYRIPLSLIDSVVCSRSGIMPSGVIDWSSEKSLNIDIPRCAIINITNDSKNAVWPTTKGQNKKYYMEFWDMRSNYFRKEVILDVQGNSSTIFSKKNVSIDICNNNGWKTEDEFSLKFGNWVAQESFHLKAYYLDYLRGFSVAAYHVFDEVYKTRGELRDRTWKCALINSGESLPSYDSEQTETDVKCFPDGFPVMVYLNGDFYGIYSWQLKKHRDNYYMKKRNPKHIHLDGEIGPASIWGESINWKLFEVRNPKGLKCVNGNEYDGDNPEEIEDGEVKDAIIRLSKSVQEIDAAFNVSTEVGKAKLEEYFDVDNLIDYLMCSMAICNPDGFNKNWQWTTWDGKKWYVNQYDLDMAFGIHFTGLLLENSYRINGNVPRTPLYYIWKYYKPEIKVRWNQLVSLDIFTKDNIVGKLKDWMLRVGEENYDREWVRWPESPCNRDPGIDSEHWELLEYKGYLEEGDIKWDSETVYNVGDEVCFDTEPNRRWLVFRAVKSNVNKTPFTIRYNDKPQYGGWRDSLQRFEEWIEDHLTKQTQYINSLK